MNHRTKVRHPRHSKPAWPPGAHEWFGDFLRKTRVSVEDALHDLNGREGVRTTHIDALVAIIRRIDSARLKFDDLSAPYPDSPSFYLGDRKTFQRAPYKP